MKNAVTIRQEADFGEEDLTGKAYAIPSETLDATVNYTTDETETYEWGQVTTRRDRIYQRFEDGKAKLAVASFSEHAYPLIWDTLYGQQATQKAVSFPEAAADPDAGDVQEIVYTYRGELPRDANGNPMSVQYEGVMENVDDTLEVISLYGVQSQQAKLNLDRSKFLSTVDLVASQGNINLPAHGGVDGDLLMGGDIDNPGRERITAVPPVVFDRWTYKAYIGLRDPNNLNTIVWYELDPMSLENTFKHGFNQKEKLNYRSSLRKDGKPDIMWGLKEVETLPVNNADETLDWEEARSSVFTCFKVEAIGQPLGGSHVARHDWYYPSVMVDPGNASQDKYKNTKRDVTIVATQAGDATALPAENYLFTHTIKHRTTDTNPNV